jgi:hypothetical protein
VLSGLITDLIDNRTQAIVFSFHHDRSARISQFHFDGRSLVLR